MKKKALSLALALAMCLSLTVPAFAADAKEGDNSISMTDSSDFTHTLNLSNPIIKVDTLDYKDGVTVYQIPEGTIITPAQPAGSQNTSEDFITYSLTEDHFVSYLNNSLSFGNGPDDAPDAPGHWNWYPSQGEAAEDFMNGKPLALGTWEIECRNTWVSGAGFDWASGAGFDGNTVNVYVQVVEADAPAQPDEPEQPTDPEPTTPPAAEPAVASPTNDSLTADGVLQTPTVYKINGSNYFKIRDLAAILNGTEKQFSVGYDSELKSVTATTGEGYEKQEGDLAGAPAGGEKTAEPSNDAIYINGEKVEAEVYKIDGSNYFKLRDLGKALDFYVGYSQETGVFLETDKPYAE